MESLKRQRITLFGNMYYKYNNAKMEKCKMVSVFTYPDVNTREVGRTRDKRRKPRREAEWFPAYRVFSQPPKCLHQAM